MTHAHPHGHGAGIPNPYIAINALDGNGDPAINITVAFEQITRAILGITTFRSTVSPWNGIAVGLGPDGTAESSPFIWMCPLGTHLATVQELQFLVTNGVVTIEQFVNAGQLAPVAV